MYNQLLLIILHSSRCDEPTYGVCGHPFPFLFRKIYTLEVKTKKTLVSSANSQCADTSHINFRWQNIVTTIGRCSSQRHGEKLIQCYLPIMPILALLVNSDIFQYLERIKSYNKYCLTNLAMLPFSSNTYAFLPFPLTIPLNKSSFGGFANPGISAK